MSGSEFTPQEDDPMLKRTICLVATSVMLACCGGCRQHDYRTLEIDVPGLKNAQCEQLMRRALARKGIVREQLLFDHDAKRVTVGYDSLFMADKNIEFFIAKVGFAANDVPADAVAAAKLPAACR
jgi:hypothetical protein